MGWALAAIVILGVGVPIAAWSYTRLHSPPPVTPLGTGYDQIDKWLLEQHRLAAARPRARPQGSRARLPTRPWHQPRMILLRRFWQGSSGWCGYFPWSAGST